MTDSGIRRVPSGRCDFGGHHRGGIQGLAEVTMPCEVARKRPHIQEGDQPEQEGEHGKPPGVREKRGGHARATARDPKQRLGRGLPRSSARLPQSCAAPCGLGTCRTWLWAGGCRAGSASGASWRGRPDSPVGVRATGSARSCSHGGDAQCEDGAWRPGSAAQRDLLPGPEPSEGRRHLTASLGPGHGRRGVLAQWAPHSPFLEP